MNCFGVLFILFACILSQPYAEASWWDKGVDVFQSLTKGVGEGGVNDPTYTEIGDAFKEALHIGTENVVMQLGAENGFNSDPAIHIPLPQNLQTVKTMLTNIGMGQSVDNLELRLNRAAESATPKAKELFLQAITNMTFEDVKSIYEGPKDSATKYFEREMSLSLKKEMQPIVENSLSQVGAIQAYDSVIGQYKTLPFVPDVKANLSEHVILKAIEGVFHYIAVEEAAIRDNPAKQTTELLKKVFGVK